MAATRRLTRLVSDALTCLRLPEAPLIVALSGGADSAALAYLASQAGAKTSALHVDHQLPGSAMMQKAAQDIAAQLELPIEIAVVSLPGGPSPEGRAREARYRVFESSDLALLTAHTRDDNAETILINLIRGAGPSGLTGIPEHRPPHIYRPMLAIGREATREIAALAGLAFIDDPMNADVTLARNRIRRHLLPLLREMNPQVVESLARAADTIGRDTAFLDALASPYGAGGSIPVSVLATLPRPVADRVLVGLLESHEIGPTSDRVDRLWSVAKGESERQELAGGRSAARRGPLLTIE